MSMFDEVERVRERRRERMEQIRLQTRDSLPPYIHELNDPIEESYTVGRVFGGSYGDDSRGSGPQTREVLGMQAVGALLILGAAYLFFQSAVPFPSPWKETARQIMTRDFNFEGVAAWYESRFGSSPSILPVLTPDQAADPASQTAPHPVWRFPQEWRLVKPYDPSSAKVVIDVGESGQVINGETGWVTYVGEKPGFGTTIVVKLASEREVWYGNVETAEVVVNDWVNPGDVLGKAKTFTGSTRYLYLALRQKEQFVDPMDVITFE
ncbi:M23 family metallopeptidase [Brevibacillus humidisoli]|uniref:M23 family metallopeptidase n=1 Tax=Brevibacillus humidisoli TaxID=2895522 RepID=UPI001E42713F|nr:M23 family metallopeptidase [Brevibacillus humidisoli]UFJ39048.1 M23 family metallopeptidase [Brevibacillus humidisoli]